MKPQLLILDFGSQVTQLIARTVRELGVYCEIIPGTISADELKAREPKALILSGGPASVNEVGAPQIDPAVLMMGVPVFGICYGMQLLALHLGGKVGGWGGAGRATHETREFGPANLKITNAIGPFSICDKNSELKVWMSHGDRVTDLPQGFEIVAASEGSPIAAFADESRKFYGVQFHPEVHHTPRGKELIEYFIFQSAGLEKDWNTVDFVEEVIQKVKEKVPQGNVICGLSGGVDSTVAAVLVNKAIGDRLHCIFVDNGLLRTGEAEWVVQNFSSLGLNITKVDASKRFLSELAGVSDPELKRKIIGRVFIEVFEAEAERVTDARFLVQGTLYPDVIESISVVGKSATIKSHHNVGGLIENMKLDLIEPLRELFKDEVRAVGRTLGIPAELVGRHPFPGPGLAVRCLGDVTEEKLVKIRKADKILIDELKNFGIYDEIWQAFVVLLPVYSVGVMGDDRTYEQAIAIRAVTSRDGMTADWYAFPEDALRKIASRIINETPGINRVVLDVSTKPPSTIEWE